MEAIALAGTIDHTLLKPEATEADIARLCEEAAAYGFATVCGTAVAVCSVAGFPLGASSSHVKATEAAEIVAAGGSEVDMVINLGRLREGNRLAVERDIRAVRDAIGPQARLKVIVEAASLPLAQKREAAQIAVTAGADFVKTSTGFHPAGGAALEDVRVLVAAVAGQAMVKAAGGIRDTETALAMLAAGASRLGTSSGVALVQGLARAPTSPVPQTSPHQ
jgi:deoxyribose-phosphate aldolase